MTTIVFGIPSVVVRFKYKGLESTQEDETRKKKWVG